MRLQSRSPHKPERVLSSVPRQYRGVPSPLKATSPGNGFHSGPSLALQRTSSTSTDASSPDSKPRGILRTLSDPSTSDAAPGLEQSIFTFFNDITGQQPTREPTKDAHFRTFADFGNMQKDSKRRRQALAGAQATYNALIQQHREFAEELTKFKQEHDKQVAKALGVLVQQQHSDRKFLLGEDDLRLRDDVSSEDENGSFGHFLRPTLKHRLHNHVEQTELLKKHHEEEYKEKVGEMLQYYHELEVDMEDARETLDALKREYADARSSGCAVFKKSHTLCVTTHGLTHSGGGSTSGTTSGSSTSGSSTSIRGIRVSSITSVSSSTRRSKTRGRRGSNPTQTSQPGISS